MEISFRKIMKKRFGVDLPISGGMGRSMDNAVIIEPSILNDYVGIVEKPLNLPPLAASKLTPQIWVPKKFKKRAF